MNVPSDLRRPALLACVLAAATARAQTLPAIPPSIDPSFWGRPNKPYVAMLTIVSSSTDGINPPQTRTSIEDVARDSTGRVRTQDFHNSGQPSFVSIRNPNDNTFTSLQLVTKKAFVLPVIKPEIPPPGRGWAVEPLPPRVIAGFPAEGLRFTRTIPASADGQRAEDTVVEEDWISNELCLVLEQRIVSQRKGTSKRTVTFLSRSSPIPPSSPFPVITRFSKLRHPHPMTLASDFPAITGQ